MKIEAVLSSEEVSTARIDTADLKERMVALSERICALAEAANIVAEVAAPLRAITLATVDGQTSPQTSGVDGATALDLAARRLEAARLDAVNEFVTLRVKLGAEVHH